MRPAATLRLHDSHAMAVAWRPDGGLLSAGLDGHLRSVAPDLSPCPPGAPQGKGLVSLALDPAGARALTGDLEGALALWDLETMTAGPPIQGHEATAHGVAWAGTAGPVSAGADGAIRSWRCPGEALEPDQVLAEGAPGEHVRWLAMDPGGVILAAVGAGGPLRLWAAGRFEEWGDLGRAVAGLAVHPTELAVAVVTFAGHLEVRRVPDGAVRGRSPAEYDQAVCPLAFSPDGSRLAVGGDGRVRLLDAGSLQVIDEDRLPGEVQGVAFAPRGARMAAAATDGRVRVYEV